MPQWHHFLIGCLLQAYVSPWREDNKMNEHGSVPVMQRLLASRPCVPHTLFFPPLQSKSMEVTGGPLFHLRIIWKAEWASEMLVLLPDACRNEKLARPVVQAGNSVLVDSMAGRCSSMWLIDICLRRYHSRKLDPKQSWRSHRSTLTILCVLFDPESSTLIAYFSRTSMECECECG